MKKILILLFSILALLPSTIHARESAQITDWYIKDFESTIVVNNDSSLTITETITADCGLLPNKHGIFRVLPTFYQTDSGRVNTPIELQSITDFSDKPLKYSTSRNNSDHTLTWKIGDADKTVTGENYYKITYIVKNAIRHTDAFDEFYWNLNGDFWQIDTDSFSADIIFPKEIGEKNMKEINIYSGSYGAKNAGLADYRWKDTNTLLVTANTTLYAGEGITLSATFPDGIIAPYKPTFFEKYGNLLYWLIPLFALIACLTVWNKFGRDFKLGRSIMAEYDIPADLAPMEFAALYKNGRLQSSAITAAIINLAVKKYLKIEQLEKSGVLSQTDYKLTKLEGKKELAKSERDLLRYLFGDDKEVKLSDLKNKFYKNITTLKNTVLGFLEKQNYFDSAGFYYQIIFATIGVIAFFGSFFLYGMLPILAASLTVASLIVLLFAALMPRRTKKGAEVFWQIMGFRLFIQMTEKYRAHFNEKENIFEKFLPYAMIFGLTKIWINNMKKIYGDDYFNSYHPVWFYGASYSSFNADTFNDMVSGLSHNMSSTIASNPSSSGSGGGGFSGGGGGGGGGGGW